jgi:hypothetical protein
LGSIQINTQRWPLIIVSFEGIPTQKEFDAYLDTMLGILNKQEKHGYVIDATRGGVLPRELRHQQGVWLKKYRDITTTYSLCTAIVLKSSALRFVLATIYLIQPPVVPTENFATLEEGIAWVEKNLKNAGIRLPR